MPIVLVLLLAVLIAQVGFWDAFAAVIGAVGMLILFGLIALSTLAIAAVLLLRRFF